MSDDLVSRLREPLSQLPGDDDTLMERVVSDRDEAATALEEARAEIERLRANVTRLTANPADHRYWEGRWRDADRELSTLRARVREVVGPFASTDLLECKDCVDNDGKHYQSQWLADALRAARQLMEEVK